MRWLVLGLLLAGCTVTPPAGTRLPTPEAEPRYYHVVWTKGTARKMPYLEIYTTGVHLFKNDWLDHSYAEFLLGGKWERFEWNAYSYYDEIVTVPAPQYKGPDRVIFHRTGTIQDF